MFQFDALAALPYHYGRPQVQAKFKQQPSDFCVSEVLGYEPASGVQQEHLWLRLEKVGQNTSWVADKLARHFKRPLSDVSYAGLKDRQAVTRQWFSIRLADPQLLSSLSLPDVSVLEHQMAAKKLQRGQLQGNRFEIRLREVTEPKLLQARFDTLANAAIPNYFGSQRFGHHANNLFLAERWRQGRYRPRNKAEKGFLISAMRAWLFNRQVADRFVEYPDSDGFLLGAMRFDMPEELQSLAAEYADQIAWLLRQGCKMQKRPIKLTLKAPELAWQGSDALLSFELPAGSYATAVLRELLLTE